MSNPIPIKQAAAIFGINASDIINKRNLGEIDTTGPGGNHVRLSEMVRAFDPPVCPTCGTVRGADEAVPDGS